MRPRLPAPRRARSGATAERLLLLAVRELVDEDRPATRLVADRLFQRLLDLCEAAARLETGAELDPSLRRASSARVGEARWALAFLRAQGAILPDVTRRIQAGLDVLARRLGPLS